jgi:hypothetical protein
VFSRLDGEHFVLFRPVWLDNQRLIQGAVIAQKELIAGLIDAPFPRDGTVADERLSPSRTAASWSAQPACPNASGIRPRRLEANCFIARRCRLRCNRHRADIQRRRSAGGAGGRVVGWATFVLAVVLLGGLAVVYRFACGADRPDAPATGPSSQPSVHELKTPTDVHPHVLARYCARAGHRRKRRRTYYDFIFHESERLSRLIANVLRLARLTRNGNDMDVKSATASELLSLVESKVGVAGGTGGLPSRTRARCGGGRCERACRRQTAWCRF